MKCNTGFLSIQSECGKYGPEKLRIRTLFTQCLTVCVFAVKAYFSKKDFHKSICWLGKLIKRKPLNQTFSMNEV